MRKIILQILVLACVVIGAPAIPSHAQSDAVVPQSQNQINLSFAPLVKKTSPAVVNIYTKRVVQQRVNPFMADPFFQQFFNGTNMGGLSREQVQSSLGSGVIIESNGLIVTNAHVVKDAKEIMVVLSDMREFEAKLSLMDERSDIALLRVDAKGEALPHAPLKSSESLQVGDLVIAIGNPFGVGQTVTSGIVSALSRSTLNINDFNFFIQTDAAINPGNSGGPLVDMTGGVVGINSAIYSQSGGSLGIGFAIPSEMVATVIAAEKNGKRGDHSITRAWVGIYGQQVTSDIAQTLGMKRPAGVLISGIHPQSPLVASGMKVGDVVTAINGKDVHDSSELKFRLATLPLGQEAMLDVLRKGEKIQMSFTAIAPPESPPRAQETLKSTGNIFDGIAVGNINPAVNVELNLGTRENGVVVLGASFANNASRLLQAGDVIVSINDKALDSVKDLKSAMKNLPSGQPFAVVVERGGQKTKIVVR